MKKLLLASFALAAVGANAQTKKVILHDYTGVNCQFCTDGTTVIEGMLASDPTNFIPIQIHTGSYTPSTSPLKTAEGDAFDAAAQPSGYPAGSVDYVKYSSNTTVAMGRGSWSAAYSTQKAKPAIASVGIANRVDKGSDTYEADIIVQFTAAPTAGVPITVNFMVIEDSIKADGVLKQINFAGGPKGGKSPLTYAADGYVHNNVLRKTLGTTWGFSGVIPATPVIGTKYTKKVTFTVDPTWVKKNLRVVAYVSYNGTTVTTQREIINAEMMKLSGFFKTGVNEVNNNNLSILNVYPTPAKVGDVVYVEYNTPTTEKVSMNVYNLSGQKVATPYSSVDVQGAHTMQFKTALYNLASGTYILEVVSESGSRQTQKIVLQ